jgi:hypothetical protein
MNAHFNLFQKGDSLSTTSRRLGKFALFLGVGFLSGLAAFWGKVFILPLIIAVLVLAWPRFVGYWGIILVALGSGIGFGLIKSSWLTGLIAGGVILIIFIALMEFSKSMRQQKKEPAAPTR